MLKAPDGIARRCRVLGMPLTLCRARLGGIVISSSIGIPGPLGQVRRLVIIWSGGGVIFISALKKAGWLFALSGRPGVIIFGIAQVSWLLGRLGQLALEALDGNAFPRRLGTRD